MTIRGSVLVRLAVAAAAGLASLPAATAAQAAGAQVTPADIAGLYFFQIDTQRGPIVGNWSFHADGTFYDAAGGTEVLDGTWTTDGTNIFVTETIPYGNLCHYNAPVTATGFATSANPSTDASCTFNHLNPNPRKDWYALKL
jgi:hypothetical protein